MLDGTILARSFAQKSRNQRLHNIKQDITSVECLCSASSEYIDIEGEESVAKLKAIGIRRERRPLTVRPEPTPRLTLCSDTQHINGHKMACTRHQKRNWYRGRRACEEKQSISQACSTNLSLRCRPFQLLIFNLLFITVAPDDEESFYDEVYDEVEDIFFPEESSPATVLAFSLMFGFFIILFGTVIAYFSFMEDSLMRTYIKDGDLIKGDVMSAEFSRGGGQVGAPCSNKRAIAEYIVFVEYSRKLRSNYDVRVRKQMKAKETDFIKPLIPGSHAMLASLKDQVEGDKIVERDHVEGIDCDGYVDIGIGPIHQSSTLGRPDEIELYVLPDFPTSALPRRQVERACGYRYRLATFAFVVVVLALAAFCTRIAAEALVDMTNPEQGGIEFYAFLFFMGLIVVQAPVIHFCLRDLFWSVLQGEYLNEGDYVPIERDDSSLSTSGSDAFLVRAANPTSLGLYLTESSQSVQSFS